MPLQAFVSEFLTFIERREERLLSWGFYGVRQSARELEDAFLQEGPEDLRHGWEEFASQGDTIRGLLQRMQRAGLLYLVPGTLDVYRTRFAEGVRLISNLRQMFSERDWAIGPRLVSDIKINLAPRTYPRRDQPAALVWEHLRPLCPTRSLALLERCFLALAQGKDGRSLAFAGFQDRAFRHIFQKYGQPGVSGSVVCAGTGSGKTKAFYIPAFLRATSELSGQPFTKVIAVYPRNVLLADQLREAIAEAEKVRPILEAHGLRPLRFGALLGSTPWSASFNADRRGRQGQWEQRGRGFVIPHLKSPIDGASDLIWRDVDRNAGRTCLFREGQEQPDVPDGVLALTRDQLIEQPPDFLFLSLEMLNREMGNPQWERTFGLRQDNQAPRLLLLDEVHAYEGVHGAQVGWVLRRWRHWAQAKGIHVVGLSATLRDAPEHLTRLAALPPGQVVEFRPLPGPSPQGEMESEGAEYNLAVKGDPAAGASLLATSIQTGMLLTRLLTPRTQAPGVGQPLRAELLYGKKVFGFSDNLDSINRWFSDMSDAERLRLAAYRRPLDQRIPPPNPPVPPNIRRRMEDEGQIWGLPSQLGHDLAQPLVVTRCSSQDPGAEANSDLIIATSSLEVGFDDPDVGAVLHHKRPGSMASFIQRKGRAGRSRGSRPWTVVVLSDYGADRLAFHSADRLFQPEVESLFLPIANPYVLRVQAALFLVDWLGKRLGGTESPFKYLAGSNPYHRRTQESAIVVLRELLQLGPVWEQFRRELLRFYQSYSGAKDADLASSQLDDLLWQEPRPLLTRAIPALLRKLEADWVRADVASSGPREDVGAGRPMPQFIPQATFMDLDVSEGRLDLEDFQNLQRDPQAVPIPLLLSEACPGRVSKRFATVPGEPGFWHAASPLLVNGANETSVRQLFPQSFFLEPVSGIQVFQPEGAALVHRPATITDSSNSVWEWMTQGRALGSGTPLPVRVELPWREVFRTTEAFLHADGTWVELLRYAPRCRFELRDSQRAQPIRGTLELCSTVENNLKVPEAVGFRSRVDGVRFVVAREHLNSRPPVSPEAVARLRPDYFLYRLQNSAVLRDIVNPFQAEWLAQMSLAMLTVTASQEGIALPQAQMRLMGTRLAAAGNVLDVIFQLRGTSATGQPLDGKLRQRLLDLWGNQVVVGEVTRLEEVLWQPPDADFAAWTRRCYVATLAQALRCAMSSMSDQVTEEDLAVDVLPAEQDVQIFVTEKSSGGLGQIEAIVREIKRKPRRFLDGIEHALTSCARMEVASDLLTIVERAVTEARTGGGLAEAFSGVRDAMRSGGFPELLQAKDSLRQAIHDHGLIARRSTVVATTTTLLRPATQRTTDGLVLGLHRSRSRLSRTLGLQIPARTFGFLAANYRPLQRRLNDLFVGISAGEAPTLPQVYSQLQQMLLDVCYDSCTDCLDQRNPYDQSGKPSRSVALAWLTLDVAEVHLDGDQAGWVELARETLRRRGRVCLVAGEAQSQGLSRGLVQLVNQELDRAGLLVPVSIAGIHRRKGMTRVTLQIRDFAND